MLKWLGHDKPPSVTVSHKVWRKQLVDRTRQLKLGADRARQRSDMLMLDGTDIVRVVEAAGARHESTGADPEVESGPAAEEGASNDGEWEDNDMGDWIAGTGVDLEGAEAGAGADAEAGASARAEVAAPEEGAVAAEEEEEAGAAGLEASCTVGVVAV